MIPIEYSYTGFMIVETRNGGRQTGLISYEIIAFKDPFPRENFFNYMINKLKPNERAIYLNDYDGTTIDLNQLHQDIEKAKKKLGIKNSLEKQITFVN